MQLGRVCGQIVSTKKAGKLTGFKILVVQPISLETFEDKGAPFVSLDGVGAGDGEVVMCVAGSSSRQTAETDARPVDNLIVAIIDSVDILGKRVFNKFDPSIKPEKPEAEPKKAAEPVKAPEPVKEPADAAAEELFAELFTDSAIPGEDEQPAEAENTKKTEPVRTVGEDLDVKPGTETQTVKYKPRKKKSEAQHDAAGAAVKDNGDEGYNTRH